MTLICKLGLEDVDLAELMEAKVWPIKLANGQNRIASASSRTEISGSFDFAIVDNKAHWHSFGGKIAALDFTLEEIRDTRPLLLAMGLEARFSSNLVREETNIVKGSRNHEITRNLRLKSRAIVR